MAKEIPKLKIVLIGYGKMGKAIEEVAISRGHEILFIIDAHNREQLQPEILKRADAAIEFTGPDSAVENLKICFDAQTPVVCGSTGWLKNWEEVKNHCEMQNGALLCASNFSIGVNIFFEINKKLALLMGSHPEYNVTIEEIHHTQKKDAPSGTAITLAEQVIHNNPTKKDWVTQAPSTREQLQIISKRIDPAPGTHIVNYQSPIDDITLTHTAHNRQGFALGAVLAAEFIAGKSGIFNMKDVLGL